MGSGGGHHCLVSDDEAGSVNIFFLYFLALFRGVKCGAGKSSAEGKAFLPVPGSEASTAHSFLVPQAAV